MTNDAASVAPAPRVSVVMPALNARATIGHAIRSVQQQTLQDFELIVIDDGSTDDTVAVVESIADERLRLVRRDHGGAAAARNVGVRTARAELVTFVDSDDLLLPGYLEAMSSALLAAPENVGFVHTDAFVLHAESGRIRKTTATERYRPAIAPTTADELYVALIRVNFVYNAVTARKSALERAGSFDESLHATIDYEMWLRLAASGFTAHEVPGPLAVYRWGRPGSISSNRVRVLTNTVRLLEIARETHAGSAEARALVEERHAFFSAELAAVRGSWTPDGIRRRVRDTVAGAAFRARSRVIWYPRESPPAGLAELFPGVIPPA